MEKRQKFLKAGDMLRVDSHVYYILLWKNKKYTYPNQGIFKKKKNKQN